MSSTPFDSTLSLKRDPYRFISRTCAEVGTDAFGTRFMLEPVLCCSGAEAARFFYDRDVFTRERAAPGFLKATLFGRGGVQGLDGSAHRHRKSMFLQLVGPGLTDELTASATSRIAALRERTGEIVLQDALEVILTGSVCEWAGVGVCPDDLPRRAKTLSNLFEHAAPTSIDHLFARVSRIRANRWASEEIEAVRAGRRAPRSGSALFVIAHWQDPRGNLLPSSVAAVELLNVLRPFVAVSVFLTFTAHALCTHPEERRALDENRDRILPFVQEVRRSYPFFPLVAARARRDAEWRGHFVPDGRLVVLDIWGTNRDPRAWDNPDEFRPARFDGWDGDPYTLIPQGGGDHAAGHRCPGEWVTQDLMLAGTQALLDVVRWEDLPAQNVSLAMGRLPALPRDRMRIFTNKKA